MLKNLRFKPEFRSRGIDGRASAPDFDGGSPRAEDQRPMWKTSTLDWSSRFKPELCSTVVKLLNSNFSKFVGVGL